MFCNNLCRVSFRAAAPLAAFALLAACSNSETTADAGTSTHRQSDSVRIADQWVKAAAAPMSAAFGTITNSGKQPVHIVSVSSPQSGRVEMHEMKTGPDGLSTMSEKPDGIAIPSGGIERLEPGGDHLMLMDLTAPINPGQSVSFTLTFEDGSATTFDTQARDFAGAKESYVPVGGGQSNGAQSDGGQSDGRH